MAAVLADGFYGDDEDESDDEALVAAAIHFGIMADAACTSGVAGSELLFVCDWLSGGSRLIICLNLAVASDAVTMEELLDCTHFVRKEILCFGTWRIEMGLVAVWQLAFGGSSGESSLL